MHAKSFIADLEQALAGGQIIAKSVAMVAAAFTFACCGRYWHAAGADLPSAPNMAVFSLEILLACASLVVPRVA